MTIQDWQHRAVSVRDQAERTSLMIRHRARVAFDQAFGYQTAAFLCFHYSHNWQGQTWLTPDQARAVRYVLHLEQKAWQPGRIADRIVRRKWAKVQY